MKVAVLGLRGFPDVQGGVEAHAQQLYTRLAQRGCELTVFSRRPYVGPGERTYRGVRLVPLGCPTHPGLEAIGHSLLAVFAARREKPDILHVHAIGPSLVVPLARLLGMKVVVTHHGPDYERQKWGAFARTMLRAGEACAVKWAHTLIAISPVIADSLSNRRRQGVVVIPNGVAPADFRPAGETLQRYSLESGRYVFAVGRLVPEKRFDDLVRAFGRWRQSAGNHEWKLVITGRADHASAYSEQLKALARRTEGVIMTGFLAGPALEELFSNAGLFVLPSSHEGLPIALLEALRYGRSCIVSDIPAHRVLDLEPDRYFGVGNINELKQCLSAHLSRPADDAAAARWIRRIQEDYDWDRIADETLRVYRQLVPSDEKKAPYEPSKVTLEAPAQVTH